MTASYEIRIMWGKYHKSWDKYFYGDGHYGYPFVLGHGHSYDPYAYDKERHAIKV